MCVWVREGKERSIMIMIFKCKSRFNFFCWRLVRPPSTSFSRNFMICIFATGLQHSFKFRYTNKNDFFFLSFLYFFFPHFFLSFDRIFYHHVSRKLNGEVSIFKRAFSHPHEAEDWRVCQFTRSRFACILLKNLAWTTFGEKTRWNDCLSWTWSKMQS